MSLNLQYENMAKSFVQKFYALLDDPENRIRVAHFYKAKESLMTVEGLQSQRASKILETIQLSFKKIQHVITVVDAQPTINGGDLICVMGRLKIDDDPPFAFSQVFVLKADGNSLVANKIFHLSELKSP
ncbi:probable nuclear transport factor 2 isoform X2 [Drosophila miranda]|uniref:probable nuclear transport factor 2 isoform X2 n=1 Tax=Drosophila miranda TaxID=7229 RepID=UPI0007E786BC|nr:probable nuclear transport factor 2 isoform X2 [Drosophila miranda]